MTLYHRRAFYIKVLVQLMKNFVKLALFEKNTIALQKIRESNKKVLL